MIDVLLKERLEYFNIFFQKVQKVLRTTALSHPSEHINVLHVFA